MLETPMNKIVKLNNEYCDAIGYGTVHLDDLIYQLGNEIGNAKKEMIKSIAESENVSYELAEWLFNKNMKIIIDFEQMEVRSVFKSIEEILYDSEVETEYDRKMEKELLESNLGKIKR